MNAPRGGWHTRTASDALDALHSSTAGLTEEDAARRLDRYGPNRLTPPQPASAIAILAAQFRSVVVGLLLGAAALSLLLRDYLDTASIVVVIAINTGLGFAIELRARRAMEALLQLGAATAAVLRADRLRPVNAESLVPGDIVELNAGETVPADGRIVSESDLRTDEAALTGESLPVGKHAGVVFDTDTPLADRSNLVYRGTTVVAGTARVLVTETGNTTEVGRIGVLTQSVLEEPTPLERRLDALGRRLVWLALGVSALVGAIGLLQGQPWELMLETAIALAVAAVPEGLPAVATIALAIGLYRMGRRHALVRRLPAVEALGSTTIICTDKTRTLTSGDMSVARVSPATDATARDALSIATLASRPQADGVTADPVDRAVLRAADEAGLRPEELLATPPIGLIPFSSDRKFMAAFRVRDGHLTAFVKGAPQRILEMSREETSVARTALMRVNDDLAGEGFRVLALATGVVPRPTEDALTDLTFAGFIGMIDPPAPGVQQAIAQLRAAGLRTIMLTGDQRKTAESIGRELGVLSIHDEAIDSRELRTLTPDALRGRLERTGVFSRVTPEDKLTIVGALQAGGEIVAMLGDGVNDAPALRKADVGVAMGLRGTDVARDAAAIVLQDDRFETIVAAVEEGRVIFDNIRKVVFYLFSCNFAEVLTLLAAGIAGLPLPLLPLQILWLNLVTDTFPALALAMEPADTDVMRRPPRDPREEILSRSFLLDVLFYGALITASTLAAYGWALARPGGHPTTVAFMTLALAQVFHLGNARSRGPVLRASAALSNPYAVGALVLSLALQIAPIYIDPLARVLRVAPLTAPEWLAVIVCSSVTAVAGQALRLVRARGGLRP